MHTSLKSVAFFNSLQSYGVSQLTLVDAGAKNELDHFPLLDPVTNMLAFEPQPAEAAKLIDIYRQHHFRSLKIKELALAEKTGEQVLNITAHNSMSSLLNEDLENYGLFFGKNRRFSSWKKNITPREKIPVQLETLDNIALTEGLDRIDYLKLDTQGYELKILEGARKFLASHKIGIIKTEVGFVSTYHDQPLFSDIDQFLRGYGYVLVDTLFYPNGYIPSILRKKAEEDPYKGAGGDAIYMLSPGHLAGSITASVSAALILASMGYLSISSALLERAGVEEKVRQSWMNLLVRKPFSRRVKQFLKNHLPPSLFYYYKQLF